METSNFEIICLNCGSNCVIIVNVEKDSVYDEDYKIIKCVNCHSQEEV